MTYLPIYFSDRELLRRLSYAQMGKVIAKLLDHATEAPTEIALSNAGEIVYAKMMQDWERSRENYDQKSRNYQDAAKRRALAKQSKILQDFGEEKEEEKDKDKYDDKDKDNAARSAHERAGARERRGGKRFLKNNSECTYKREDLFVSIFDIEDAEAAKRSEDGDSP